MRVTRETHASHGSAMLEAASRLFRRRGIDRVSIAEVAREAGLTHGAFYGHYANKTALAEAAARDSLMRGATAWRVRAAKAREAGKDPLAAIVVSYLDERHCGAPENGCALAALGPEMTRADPALRQAMADGTDALASVLAEEIGARRPDLSLERAKTAAMAMLSAMTGGVLLARAFRDPERATAALAAARAAAMAAADL